MLKYILESLDGLDKSLHSFYKEKDGKFILQVEGIKTDKDFDDLKSSLTKERAEHKATKTKLDEYADIRATGHSAADILDKLDRFDELEAAAGDKIDEGKLEKMVETRLKAKTAPLERDITKLKGELAEKDTKLNEFTVKDRTRTIHDAVRKAATEGKVVATAVDDVLMIAERLFDVDESGKVTSKDNVGITPGVGPEAWLSDVQTAKPHWFPTSSGGGAGGSGNGGGGFANNPFTNEHWNVTEQGKLHTANPTRAQQMMAAAGVKALGQRPVKK